MPETMNPYQPPSADLIGVEDSSQPINMVGAGRRFLNHLIDLAAYQAVQMGLLAALTASLGAGTEMPIIAKPMPAFLFGISIMLAYYVVMEACFQRTLGKIITGTIVIDEDGKPPTLGQVVIRTICRMVPFEAFSCFGEESRGWHDRWSKTYVVRARKSGERQPEFSR